MNKKTGRREVVVEVDVRSRLQIPNQVQDCLASNSNKEVLSAKETMKKYFVIIQKVGISVGKF
jgi:hypothetical protein